MGPQPCPTLQSSSSTDDITTTTTMKKMMIASLMRNPFKKWSFCFYYPFANIFFLGSSFNLQASSL
jgi:hypothetical protein